MAIICGTDFSVHSEPALRAAAALAARPPEQELWVVHVLDPALSDGLEGPQLEKLKGEVAQRLGEHARQLCPGAPPERIKHAVLTGPAAEALAKFAATKQASLVVVSSQGHGASPLYRLGGTSERVAVESEVPVLVVRDAAPFEAWARGDRPLRILVGLDFTASSDHAVGLTKILMQAGSCEVVFAHVHHWYEVATRYGAARLASDSLIEVDKQTDALLIRDLTARVGELVGEGTVRFLPKVGVGRIGDHLLEVAEAEKADLIIVGTHRRRGARRLASVASVVLHYGHASVACVPPGRFQPAEARPIRRVLIATDLSPFSNYAVPHAYQLLSSSPGAEAHLLHVVAPESGKSRVPEQEAELVRQLRQLVPSWAAERGIVTRTEVVQLADVARAVQEAARRNGADVICMASHGRSGILQAVLGSTAEKVIRESSVPVFIVRPPQP